MKIVVIDGQGGKMGAALTKQFLESFPTHTLTAIGTNSLATQAMLKAGATHAATGENPVVLAARDADLIAGPIGILCADSLLGEITPTMAQAIGASPATKIVIPITRCAVLVAGAQALSLTDYMKDAVAKAALVLG